MSPFENGLNITSGFHATMSRKVAKKAKRRVQKTDYKYLYNPMWSLYGDLYEEPPGTYYYSKADFINFQWHMFDQVLLTPSLIDKFDTTSLKIVTTVGDKSLLKKDGTPDKLNYSDHLPIVFTINY